MHERWPWLPTELYTDILSFLPLDDDYTDASVQTLLNCLSANSQLRQVAKQSSIWKPHYLWRYTECVEEKEAERKNKFRGDYRLMYIARRALDRRALEAVDDIRLQLHERHAKAATFAREFSFDAWNALEREAELPLPSYFCGDGGLLDEDVDMDFAEVPHALPRRYWAKAMMGLLARRYTLQKWIRLYSDEEEDQPVTFEDALAGLSAFHDYSPKYVSASLIASLVDSEVVTPCFHRYLIGSGCWLMIVGCSSRLPALSWTQRVPNMTSHRLLFD